MKSLKLKYDRSDILNKLYLNYQIDFTRMSIPRQQDYSREVESQEYIDERHSPIRDRSSSDADQLTEKLNIMAQDAQNIREGVESGVMAHDHDHDHSNCRHHHNQQILNYSKDKHIGAYHQQSQIQSHSQQIHSTQQTQITNQRHTTMQNQISSSPPALTPPPYNQPNPQRQIIINNSQASFRGANYVQNQRQQINIQPQQIHVPDPQRPLTNREFINRNYSEHRQNVYFNQFNRPQQQAARPNLMKPQTAMISYQNNFQQNSQPTQNSLRQTFGSSFAHRNQFQNYREEEQMRRHSQSPPGHPIYQQTIPRPQTNIIYNREASFNSGSSYEKFKPLTPNVSFNYARRQNVSPPPVQIQPRPQPPRQPPPQYLPQPIYQPPQPQHQHQFSYPLHPQPQNPTQPQITHCQQHLITLNQKFVFIYHQVQIIISQMRKVDSVFDRDGLSQKTYQQLKMQYTLLMEELDELSIKISEYKEFNDEYCNRNRIGVGKQITNSIEMTTKEVTTHSNVEFEKKVVEIREYQKKCNEMEGKLKYFAEQYSKLDSQYHKLDALNVGLQKEIGEWKMRYEQLIIQMQQIQQVKPQPQQPKFVDPRLSIQDEQIKRLTEIMQNMEQQKISLLRELEISHLEIKNLRQYKPMVPQPQIKPVPTIDSSAHLEVEHLRKILTQQEHLIDQLSSKLDAYNLEISGYKQEIQSLKNTIKVYKSNEDTFQRKISSLEISNQELQSSYKRLTIQRNSFQERLEQSLLKVTEFMKNNKQQQIIEPKPEIRRPAIVDNSQAVKEYEEMVQKLRTQIRENYRVKIELQDHLLNYEQMHNRSVLQKDSEIRQLNEKLMMLQKQSNQRIKDRQNMINNLENKIKDLESFNNNQSISPTKNNYDIHSSKTIHNLQNTVTSLEQQIHKKSQQITKMKHEIMNIDELKKQLDMLNKNLKKKNQQLLKYKQLQLKVNEMNMEIEITKQENKSFKDNYSLKVKEVEDLRRKIRDYEIQPTRKSSISRSEINRSEEMDVMNDALKRKDIDINKLRQEIQLKDTNIEELSYGIQKLRNKVDFTERNLVREKQEYEERIRYLEGRMKELELRNRESDSYQRENTSVLEAQISKYQAQLREKDNTLVRLESDLTQLRNRIKVKETEQQEGRNQYDSLSRQYQKLEIEYNQIVNKLQTLESSRVNIGEYQAKISQLQSTIGLRDKKIKQVENLVETLKSKLSEAGNKNEDEYITQQQIEVLKRKITEYQSKITAYQKHSMTATKARDYNSTYVFQQKVIYDLKSQNERLRKLLEGKDMTSYVPSKDTPSANYSYIQKRLVDFNKKLENMINENRKLEETAEFGHYETMNDKRKSSFVTDHDFQRQKLAMIRAHRKQINEMQGWMIQLHKYCASFEGGLQNSSIGEYQFQKQIKSKISVYDKSMASEHLQYYKQINKELQQRIDLHICLNRELKEKLEAYLNVCPDPKLILFYKEQLQINEKKIDELDERIKKITDKNSLLQKQLEEMGSCHINQIEELRERIQELQKQLNLKNRQNTYLEGHLSESKIEIERVNLLVGSLREEINQMKSKHNQNELKYKNRISELESELMKAINKNSFLEMEMNKIRDSWKYEEQAYNDEAEKNASKINTLTNKIRELQGIIYEKNHQIDGLTEELQRLAKSLQSKNEEVTSLKILMDVLSKEKNSLESKLRELQTLYETQRIQLLEKNGTIASFELQIRQLQRTIDSLRTKLQMYEENSESSKTQIDELRNQIFRLQREIDRLKNIITQIQVQLQTYQGLKRDISYKIEYTRSLYLMLQSLVGQLRVKKQDSQVRLLSKIQDSLQLGLTTCSEMSAIL